MEDQNQEDQHATALSVEVEHNGVTLVATLPDVFAALAPILPVANTLFGGKKAHTVDSRDLHKALNPARNHSTWWIGVVKKHGLVGGVDYLTDTLDPKDPANWPAITANGGKVPTKFYIVSKVAAKIATFSGTETGQQVWEYMYAVTDAAHDVVHDYYQRELLKKKQELLESVEELKGERRVSNSLEKKALALAKEQGFDSYTLALNHRRQMREICDEMDNLRRLKEVGEGGGFETYAQFIDVVVENLLKHKKKPERVEEIALELAEGSKQLQSGNYNYRSYL